MYIRFRSRGSSKMVCRHRPPAPGFHSPRCGWSYRLSFNVQVSPRSSEMNNEAGCAPAYNTFGSLARPGLMFHTLIIFSGLSLILSPPSERNASSTVLAGLPDFDERVRMGTSFAWVQVLPKSSE